MGVSLGGNVLLKWLGEQGARSPVEAAATISVPYDLAAASRHLERGFARFYAAHFLKPLKRKALDFLIINAAIFFTHAILHGFEPFAGLVGSGAVRQMPTGGEGLSEDAIARLQQRHEHALIGLRAGAGLDVDIFAIE